MPPLPSVLAAAAALWRLMRLVLALALLSLLPTAAAAVTIDNAMPRRDQHGNILNAHDGHIITVNGTYWLFGTSYTHCLMTDGTACLGTCGTMGGKCAYPISPDAIPNHPACGWTNNDFAAYSSTDLISWRLENPSILPADEVRAANGPGLSIITRSSFLTGGPPPPGAPAEKRGARALTPRAHALDALHLASGRTVSTSGRR